MHRRHYHQQQLRRAKRKPREEAKSCPYRCIPFRASPLLEKIRQSGVCLLFMYNFSSRENQNELVQCFYMHEVCVE